jgi:Mrp family chromosome partitioning ATPase
MALQALRERFDWVIVDGPPATVYSDAGILAPLVDGVVLVVEAEKTRWQVAEQAKRTLEESGAQLLGAVLSRRQFHIPEALYGLL